MCLGRERKADSLRQHHTPQPGARAARADRCAHSPCLQHSAHQEAKLCFRSSSPVSLVRSWPLPARGRSLPFLRRERRPFASCRRCPMGTWLSPILPELRRQGYQFVTVGDLVRSAVSVSNRDPSTRLRKIRHVHSRGVPLETGLLFFVSEKAEDPLDRCFQPASGS